MLRIAFGIFVALHGLIHLMGFIKAFKLAEINQLSQSISKPQGLAWLFVALVFGLSISFFLFNKNWWWLIGFIAILFSQILIVSSWQDAKFGTVANTIILLICLIGFGGWKFDKMVRRELNSFLPQTSSETQTVPANSLSHLPKIVQLWLTRSNVVGQAKTKSVHLYQSGRMKTKPDSPWMKVKAEQWFTIPTPGFIWKADVGEGSFIQFSGRDKFVNGKGNMLIKLFSLIPIVDEEGEKLDQGVMVRYLSEIIWFPSAAINNYITWEEITPLKVKAILTYDILSVSGIFTFNEQGQPISFQAQRFYDKTGELETWFIGIDESNDKIFNEKSIPSKATVTWKLKNGDFTWYEVEIEELEQE